MPSWNRDGDRALDAELRAARPEPSDAITQAIAERVRPRETAGRQRFGRLHLALAGALTALVLTPVVATGFGGFGSLGKSTKASSKSGTAVMSKARNGHARGSLSRAGKAALAKLAGAGSTSSAAGAGLGSGSDASLTSRDEAGGFLGDIGGLFAPQNDLQATQDQYGLDCKIVAVIQDNDATLTQGGNTATGGNATATGGAGGDASTGNTQTGNGGGTTSTSGNATGGSGGSATATGGDAVAGNVAVQILINVVCT